MKTIILTEEQLNMLIETESAPDFEGGDVKEFGNSSEVSTTATVHDVDGNPKYGEMPIGDELGDFLAVHNWWANSHNGGRVVP